MSEPTRPWYRQLWPWLIMTPPAAAVVGGFITLYLALAQPPAPVAGEYDAQRISAVARSNLEDQARALGLDADLRLSPHPANGPGRIRVKLSAREAGNLPDRVRVRLIHRTRESDDREVLLTRQGSTYSGEIQRPAGRLWVELQDEPGSWRLSAELPETQDRVLLQPRPGIGYWPSAFTARAR